MLLAMCCTRSQHRKKGRDAPIESSVDRRWRRLHRQSADYFSPFRSLSASRETALAKPKIQCFIGSHLGRSRQQAVVFDETLQKPARKKEGLGVSF